MVNVGINYTNKLGIHYPITLKPKWRFKSFGFVKLTRNNIIFIILHNTQRNMKVSKFCRLFKCRQRDIFSSFLFIHRVLEKYGNHLIIFDRITAKNNSWNILQVKLNCIFICSPISLGQKGIMWYKVVQNVPKHFNKELHSTLLLK